MKTLIIMLSILSLLGCKEKPAQTMFKDGTYVRVRDTFDDKAYFKQDMYFFIEGKAHMVHSYAQLSSGIYQSGAFHRTSPAEHMGLVPLHDPFANAIDFTEKDWDSIVKEHSIDYMTSEEYWKWADKKRTTQ